MAPAPTARSRVEAAAWSLAYLVGGYFLTTMLLAGLTSEFSAIGLTPGGGLAGSALVQAVAGVAAFGFLTWLIGRRVLRLSWGELGWTNRRDAFRGFLRAFGVGFGTGAIALALGVPLAGSEWRLDGGTFGQYVARSVAIWLALLPASFMEELAFRGVAIAGFERAMGRGAAIVVTAIVFGLAHGANPGITPLALGNTALAGVFLGLTFFARGGLFSATGAHIGWNLALAGLAAPVSGLPFEIPWIDFIPGEPTWFTGGEFGPEGGLLATFALLIGVVLVARWRDFRGQEAS
jgi:membrane protease YdiL (CAAX protease family)